MVIREEIQYNFMKTISFLQFTREPDLENTDLYTMASEFTGAYGDEDEYEVTAFFKEEVEEMEVLKSLKEFYDFDVWCYRKDGEVIMTEEDLSDCCGAKIVNGRCFDCKDNVR